MKDLRANLIVVTLFIYTGVTIFGQEVGINVDPHPSAMFHVQSTDKGVLIPRMDSTQRVAISSPALGLLVFDTDSNSFWYHVGGQWRELKDHDWYRTGTVQGPLNIEDDIYRQGKVAIGKTKAVAQLDLSTNVDTAVYIYSTSSDSAYGSYTVLDSATVGYGSYNSLVGTGAGRQYGIYQNLDVSGHANHYGVYTTMAGGTGTHYGMYNKLNEGSFGDQYGIYNHINNTGGSSFAWYWGVYNEVSGGGTGSHFGVLNRLNGNGSGDHFSTYNVISNPGEGTHKGTLNMLIGPGTGDHYGTVNTMGGSGLGIQYGTYNELTQGTGTLYGSYNEVSSSGSGIHVAGYYDAPGGDNDYAAIFNQGNVVVNESGGDYDFRVESKDSTHLLFVDADANRVGIGTSSPDRRIHVQSIAKSTTIAKFENVHRGFAGDGIMIKIGPDTANAGINNKFIEFRNGSNTFLGAIVGDGSGGVNYNTTSDRRLKQNISTYKDGLETVMKLEARQYQMISQPNINQIGFIAQELAEVLPSIVSGSPDDRVDEPMTVDYSKLTPVLLSAIQQQQRIIEKIERNNRKLEIENRDIKSSVESLSNWLSKLEKETINSSSEN